MSKSDHKKQVGRNLIRAMEALGIQQADLKRLLGVDSPKIGNWLRGDNYPDPYLLTLVCDRYGLTMDWIYRGVIPGLPGGVADYLARAKLAAPEPAEEAQLPAPKKQSASNAV